MYQVGDKVIHSLHGLGTVESVEEKQILGKVSCFSIISFQDGDLKIMQNVAQRNAMLRPPIDEEEVTEVLEYMKNCTETVPSNNRQKHNVEKIKSGSIYAVCEVVKDLTALSCRKKLTAKQQHTLEQSRRSLIEELSYVTSRNWEEVEQFIDTSCRYGLN